MEEEPSPKRMKTLTRALRTPWSGPLFGHDRPMPFMVQDEEECVRMFLRPPSTIKCTTTLFEKGIESSFATLRVVFDEDAEWRTDFLKYENKPPPPEKTYTGLGITDPVCHHNVTAKKSVTKSNAKGNMGREYYSCGANVNFYRRCDFFMWVDDLDQVEPFVFLEPDTTRVTSETVAAAVDDIDDARRLQMWSQLEQGSEEWLVIRRNPWATASSIGYIIDTKKVHGLTIKKVWVADGGHGSAATRHGHAKEPDAVRLIVDMLSATEDVKYSVLTGYGTWVSRDGTVAVSPDGVIFVYRHRGTEVDPPHIVVGLECKAPYSSRECAADASVYPVAPVNGDVRGRCSAVYYAQVQTLMRELGLMGFVFVAITSRVAEVSYIPFDEPFADNVARAAAEWSLRVIMPLQLLRNTGSLEPGSVWIP